MNTVFHRIRRPADSEKTRKRKRARFPCRKAAVLIECRNVIIGGIVFCVPLCYDEKEK